MEKHKSEFTICIAGRPNVGKSSLFNCLLGERRAVVVAEAGTTRDSVEAVMSLGKFKVKLIDTGGYLLSNKDELSMQVKDRIYGSIQEALIVIIMVDTMSGITPADEEFALLLRKSNKHVIVVANKADNDKFKGDTLEFYRLGFGEPLAVSCLHRRGIRRLKEILLEHLKGVGERGGRHLPEAELRQIRIAVVGRPNVGKSCYVNNLLKRERVIVSDIPGTTRDSIDTRFTYEGDEYVLVDTAGIRHKRKVKAAADVYSVIRSKEAIEKADVSVLLIDVADGMTRDDMRIMDFIEEKGKPCLVLVNKWDLAEETPDISGEEYKKELVNSFEKLKKYPMEFISSKTGKNVLSSFAMVKVLDANLDIKAPTPMLNKIFEKKDPSNVAVPRSKKRPRFYYITQTGQRPVEFKYFVDDTSAVIPAHISFIENQLRANLPLSGIPFKVIFKRSNRERK
ncbi:MAG: ribosome biogenesis GTPase Der [Candidatus Omnitrophota bacterium]